MGIRRNAVRQPAMRIEPALSAGSSRQTLDRLSPRAFQCRGNHRGRHLLRLCRREIGDIRGSR